MANTTAKFGIHVEILLLLFISNGIGLEDQWKRNIFLQHLIPFGGLKISGDKFSKWF